VRGTLTARRQSVPGVCAAAAVAGGRDTTDHEPKQARPGFLRILDIVQSPFL
jgi:hypothetical protein